VYSPEQVPVWRKYPELQVQTLGSEQTP